jgi:luciferase family oxidoreductase group 1
MISLTCLDYCLLRGRSHRQAVSASISTAKHAERLGYSRYWLAEHHTSDVAHSTPEILVPLVANSTATIHVGVAGTLLRYHNPYRIARSFKLLEAVFPGRIELGIARSGVDNVTATLLGGERDTEELEKRTRELCRLLPKDNRSPAFPQESVWMLGGFHGMRSAVQNGLSFSLCLFVGDISEGAARDILTEYRDTRKPSQSCVTPNCSIAVAGICAESFDQAEALFREATTAGLVHVKPTILGSPEHCKAVLEGLADSCGTEEFVFLDLCPRVEDRMRSLSLLAEKVGLDKTTGGIYKTPEAQMKPDNNQEWRIAEYASHG